MPIDAAAEPTALADAAILTGWLVAAAALLASVAVAAWGGWLKREGRSIVPAVPWPKAQWNGVETVLFAFCWLILVGVAVAMLPADAALVERMAAQAAGSIIATMALVAVLRFNGVSWRSIGLSSFDAALDWRLALAAVLLVTGPLLVVSAALERLVKYEHPVIDALSGDHDWGAIAVVAITAVIAAPLAEELFFRRILLGWLDARFPSPGGRIAIVGSALAFGLSHWGQGLAWVPLVGLGVVLGELAFYRGSIVPAILLHGLFNAVSVVILVIQILSGQLRGG